MDGITEKQKQLWEAIEKDFDAAIDSDLKLLSLKNRIESNSADYEDAHAIAIRTGDIVSDALLKNLTVEEFPNGMSFDDAANTLRPALKAGYEYVSNSTEQIQKLLNEKANIGLNAIKPDFDKDRVDGLCSKISSEADFQKTQWILEEPVKNYMQSIVDKSVEKNADFAYNAGMSPIIKRIATGKCCKWCRSLAGKHDYPTETRDVYRRHEFCRCIVLYDPGNGKVQDVHSKIEYPSQRKAVEARLKKEESIRGTDTQTKFRKAVIDKRANEILNILYDNPMIFKTYTPTGLKALFEACEYDVKPLSSGSQKNRLFEDGGGWKINFDSERLLMYHPKEGSHHNDEYYKISSGEKGTARYDKEGNIIK